jgi:hypothetical protein
MDELLENLGRLLSSHETNYKQAEQLNRTRLAWIEIYKTIPTEPGCRYNSFWTLTTSSWQLQPRVYNSTSTTTCTTTRLQLYVNNYNYTPATPFTTAPTHLRLRLRLQLHANNSVMTKTTHLRLRLRLQHPHVYNTTSTITPTHLWLRWQPHPHVCNSTDPGEQLWDHGSLIMELFLELRLLCCHFNSFEIRIVYKKLNFIAT